MALLGGPEAFRSYFGGLHPLAAAVAVWAAGGLSLRYLSRVSPLQVRSTEDSRRGLVYATLLATGLAAVIAAADFFLVPFPADLNVLWPQSLAFYPPMAYVAEVVFHLVPLALLYLIVRSVLRTRSSHRDAVPLVVFGVTVFLEPIFQVLPSVAGAQLAPTAVVVFLQVLAFNVTALWLFVRFDFLTAYVFRVIYYLYWHILWGHFRLDVLF